MKNLLLIIALLLVLPAFSHAQDEVKKLIKEGIELHDSKQYSAAIEVYKKALKIDPKSILAHYEISMSYLDNGDYKKSIKHADKVIKNKGEHLDLAYVIKGSALDMQGKTKKSIALFEEAIEAFPDNYSLEYNLAVNYFKLRDYENASVHAQRGAQKNNMHTSSHYMLAVSEQAQGRKVEGLLASYFFLLLEPTGQRAQLTHILISDTMGYGVNKKDENNIQVALNMDSQFSATEIFLSLHQAAKLTEQDTVSLTAEEQFIEDTKTLFTTLSSEHDKKETNIWHQLYVPLFTEILNSDHFETFCHYIYQNKSEVSAKWLEDHPVKLIAFEDWL